MSASLPAQTEIVVATPKKSRVVMIIVIIVAALALILIIRAFIKLSKSPMAQLLSSVWGGFNAAASWILNNPWAFLGIVAALAFLFSPLAGTAWNKLRAMKDAMSKSTKNEGKAGDALVAKEGKTVAEDGARYGKGVFEVTEGTDNALYISDPVERQARVVEMAAIQAREPRAPEVAEDIYVEPEGKTSAIFAEFRVLHLPRITAQANALRLQNRIASALSAADDVD